MRWATGWQVSYLYMDRFCSLPKQHQLENVFVKHYAPNHMPNPKGEWSYKENNSELHNGNIQKLVSSSTSWSVTICQISGSYPKQFFRYFVHKVVPIQNTCVWKRGISQSKIFGIGSKVNQFIYTLVCNYMPNIRILGKLVLQIFCSQGCSYTKCLCLKKGSNSTKNFQNMFRS